MDSRLTLPITYVTVHPGQARIERSGPLPATLTAGSLSIIHLPLLLLESSVQVRIEGAPLEVAELTVGWDLTLPEDRARPELEQVVRDQEAKLAMLQARALELEQQIAFWSALVPDTFNSGRLPFAGEEAAVDLLQAADAWQKSLQLVDGKVAAGQASLRALQLEIKQAQRQLELDRDALSRASNTGLIGPVRRRVELRLVDRPDGAATGESARIVLSYLVPGAGWLPSYEVRLSADGLEAEMSIKALVAQRTGEDWSGVRLSVSTADARYTTELPVLPALRIGRAQPMVSRTGWRPPPEGLEALFVGYDRDRPSWLGQEKKKVAPPPPPPPAPARKTLRARLQAQVAQGQAELGFDDEQELEGAAFTTLSGFASPLEAPPMAPGNAPPPPASRGRVGAGAPPMPSARPLPSAPPPDMAMPAAKRAASPASIIAAPVAMAARAVADVAEMAKAGLAGGGGAPSGAPPAAPGRPAGEAALEVAADWLNFDHLRLAGPGEAQRGRLKSIGVAEGLREVLSDEGQVQTVLNALSRAQADADAVTRLEMPVHGRPVQQSRGRFDHRYDAAFSLDVPSDGRYHALTLVRARGAARIVHRTVPRVEPVVYRELVLTNPLAAPLLSGPSDLYIGADLIATSALETVAAGGSIRLGLGVEDRIKVARNTRYKESAAGLLSGSLSLEHEILIQVASQLDRPAEIEVLERLPVTDENDIEIKETLAEPPATVYDQLDRGSRVRGGRRFLLSVEPRGEAKCRLCYKVVISSKNELVYGNRRD